MNEAETRAELIDPALAATGWGVAAGSRVRREVIAPGRLQGGGRRIWSRPETRRHLLDALGYGATARSSWPI